MECVKAHKSVYLHQFLASLTHFFRAKHLFFQTQSDTEKLPLQVFLRVIHHCGTAVLRWAWLKPRCCPARPPRLYPSPYCFIHVASASLAFALCSLSITRVVQQVLLNWVCFITVCPTIPHSSFLSGLLRLRIIAKLPIHKSQIKKVVRIYCGTVKGE